VLAAVLFFAFNSDDGDTTTTTVPVAVDTTQAPTTTTVPEETTTVPEETTTTVEETPMPDPILACQVTDTGGIDDKSFNQTAWKGVEDAIAAGYAKPESSFLESQEPTDYEPHIQSFMDAGCDIIITVGFLLGDATEAAAQANPDQAFQIIDFLYDPPYPMVEGAIFGTTDAAFLAGYLAAGMTETGTVATYGGIQIPCGVTCFMDGFVYGVRYYNSVNGTDVQTLGWNPEEQTGVFTGDFENADNGRNVTQSFVDEGADIVLPVAGPVGVGTAALAQELGNVWVIGVDADWFITLPEFEDVILTSVLKGLDVAVSTAIAAVADGTFEGSIRLYTIGEDGVGLGAINSDVPSALTDELAGVDAGLRDGSIVPADQATG
jgi:basic membrane protein A